MPRLRKITLDAPNGRVIESTVNPRVARKPVFYAGETVSVDVNVVEQAVQADNTVGYDEIRTAGSNTVGMRLGTTTTLVAQGTEFIYSPPARYQATLGITTGPSVTLPLVVESAAIPTTPMELLVNEFVPAQTNNLTITLTGGVTATLRANMLTQTLPATTVAVPLQDPDAFQYPGLEIFVAGTCVTFSSLVNNPVAATFTVTTLGGTVSSIGISNGGSGYPNGTYDLVFTGGTVTSVAEATCVATGGSVVSVTIVTGGSGYVTKPSASLFAPARQVTSVIPSVQQGTVNNRRQFYWHRPADGVTSVTLSFAQTENTGTPVADSQPVVLMEYVRVDASGMALWEINLVSGGYGYTSAPAVTVPGHPVSARRRTTSASLSGSNMIVSRSVSDSVVINAEDGCLIPGPDPYHLAMSGSMNNEANSALGAELRVGTYEITQVTAPGLGNIRVVFPDGNRGLLGRSVRNFGVISRSGRQIIDLPGNTVTPQSLQDLAGRTFLCAVIPQRDDQVTDAGNHALNETAPERYAIVKLSFPSFPGGVPQYYVGQKFFTESAFPEQVRPVVRGLLDDATYAPGHGFFEPTIEFLDYGKGYKTTTHVGSNAHARYSYNLRVLSGLRPGYVIDSTPAARTITGVTIGTLGKDSYIATPFSSLATIATRIGERGIETYVQDGGFGYHRAGYFTAGVATVSGAIRNIQVTNRPWGYAFGTYPLTISGGGGSGAAGELVVDRQAGSDGTRSGFNIYARVTCAGSGYTGTPTVTAPSPNLNVTTTGQVPVTVGGGVGDGFYVAYTPQGISNQRPHVAPKGWRREDLNNRGPFSDVFYGYAASPFGTTSSIRRTRKILYSYNSNGNIIYLNAKETPPRGAFRTGEEIYQYEQEGVAYPLVFDASPEPDGTAEGFVIFETRDRVENYGFRVPRPYIFITKTGYGYVTKPNVTIQAPDLSGHYLKKITLDLTQLPRVTNIGPVPLAANTAFIPTAGIPDTVSTSINEALFGHQLVVTPGPKYAFHEQDIRLRVETLDFRLYRAQETPALKAIFDENQGKKIAYVLPFSSAIYATPPTVSTPTFPGFAITSVSVTCQGYFYDSSAEVLENDPDGSGSVIRIKQVSQGKITQVELVNGGSGFSPDPRVELSQPGFNPRDLPSEFGIKANFTVPTATANSVLGSENQQDAFLELYENAAGSESVLAQVPVTLAKRVKT